MRLNNFAQCIAILRTAQDKAGRVGTDENPVVLSKEEEAQLRELGWFEQPTNNTDVEK